MRREGKARIYLEDDVEIDSTYKTLFFGLKMNTQNKSAVTMPLAFFLRRIFFALSIVFLYRLPIVTIFFLILTSMISMAFVFQEQPW